jgi:hypothetical protein
VAGFVGEGAVGESELEQGWVQEGVAEALLEELAGGGLFGFCAALGHRGLL